MHYIDHSTHAAQVSLWQKSFKYSWWLRNPLWSAGLYVTFTKNFLLLEARPWLTISSGESPAMVMADDRSTSGHRLLSPASLTIGQPRLSLRSYGRNFEAKTLKEMGKLPRRLLLPCTKRGGVTGDVSANPRLERGPGSASL